MSSIQDIFQQAQLAEAAYANLWDATLNQTITAKNDVTTALITEGMSDAQATDFVNHWRVVSQYTASGGLTGQGSGFSATVFESLDNPGQYSFAIRGSENLFSVGGAIDWGVADISDIGTQGFALHQAIDLRTMGSPISRPASSE